MLSSLSMGGKLDQYENVHMHTIIWLYSLSNRFKDHSLVSAGSEKHFRGIDWELEQIFGFLHK